MSIRSEDSIVTSNRQLASSLPTQVPDPVTDAESHDAASLHAESRNVECSGRNVKAPCLRHGALVVDKCPGVSSPQSNAWVGPIRTPRRPALWRRRRRRWCATYDPNAHANYWPAPLVAQKHSGHNQNLPGPTQPFGRVPHCITGAFTTRATTDRPPPLGIGLPIMSRSATCHYGASCHFGSPSHGHTGTGIDPGRNPERPGRCSPRRPE